VTVSHPPGGTLPLISARPAVIFPAAEQHRPLAGIGLYCLVTEAHRCEQLAQGCDAAMPRVGFLFFLYKQVIQWYDTVQMLYDDLINENDYVGFKRATEDRELKKYNRR